ncbi:hypothetical protein DLAC_02703 [Tieghemostelium lacteum]|uniref:Uncharacterized protein n=1 Tax=Tieghemostelium lacteum TaxID=361077 RepID=A0A152A385_TIELA|nr:hypothetical protein DLAC_02703 [Tieghemostelium lacteum]|eukprot:KYR00669.1 hypothetical protein DLAC_02703 [Tieghemostelium lacteum]
MSTYIEYKDFIIKIQNFFDINLKNSDKQVNIQDYFHKECDHSLFYQFLLVEFSDNLTEYFKPIGIEDLISEYNKGNKNIDLVYTIVITIKDKLFDEEQQKKYRDITKDDLHYCYINTGLLCEFSIDILNCIARRHNISTGSSSHNSNASSSHSSAFKSNTSTSNTQ